jgi:hypothetical protein
MSGSTERKSGYDMRHESYAPFFDTEWGKEFVNLILGTKLEDAGHDLIRAWDSASETRSNPWLMAKCLDAAIRSRIPELEPPERAFVRSVTKNFLSMLRAEGANVRNMLEKQIIRVLEKLGEKADRIMSRTHQTLADTQDNWQVLLSTGDEGFKRSLWMSERNTYGAIYFAYEFYLVQLVSMKRGESCRAGSGFGKMFENAFGNALLNSCWNAPEIVIPRLIRHALVHAGGRLTEDLKRQKNHGLETLNDNEEIQIYAPQTTDLFNLLKGRATTVTAAALEMSEFK